MQAFVRRAQPHQIPGVEDWLASLLHARGVQDAAQAEAFLSPRLEALHDPLCMQGMAQAVALIRELGGRKARAVVYGDYDVDGLCAAVIAEEALRAAGLKTMVYIPDRHTEGYGINADAVRKLAPQAELLLTVDCGITAVDEVALARELGLRVIVTDHHQPPDVLPPADAVINPLLGGYAFPGLCGAGTAWKLSCALHGLTFSGRQLDLAAMATIADMVPLLEENRIIAFHGLKALEATNRPGLLALMRAAGLTPGQRVSADRVGFGLAPRLNAGGRLTTAQDALQLLRTTRDEEAEALAQRLDDINRERQQQERQVIDQAEALLAGENLLHAHSIVLCGEGWNSGVVGLAAGRLAEKYGFPTVVLTRDGDAATGSGRTAGGIDLYEALKACGDLFTRFGGHRAAAGMTLSADNVPLLRQRFDQAVRSQLGGRPLLPQVYYDVPIDLADVQTGVIERMDSLAPFGIGNPAPAFLLENVDLASARRVGADGRHLKMALRARGQLRDGIAFGLGDRAEGMPPQLDAVVRLSLNEYAGRVSPQFQLQAYRAGEQAFLPDPAGEQRALLQDLAAIASNVSRLPARAEEWPGGDVPLRGTLLLCRTHDTAQQMHQRWPQLGVASGDYADRRGSSAVLYRVPLAAIQAPCDALVFCDGLLGEVEAAWAAECFPEARLYAMPRAAAMEGLLAPLRLSVDELRQAYVQARRGDSLLALGWTPARAHAAALILQELGLARLEDDRLHLLPMTKRDPADSLLYCLLQS